MVICFCASTYVLARAGQITTYSVPVFGVMLPISKPLTIDVPKKPPTKLGGEQVGH